MSLALTLAGKDLKLVLARGSGLVQALLLGLLLIFIFSLAKSPSEVISPQAAAAVFWLASLFCQVLVFNTLFSLEEDNGARVGLLLSPIPPYAIWLGKALAGAVLLLAAQVVFVPAVIVFLGQDLSGSLDWGLGMLAAVDMGMVAMGALLGALAQGQAARESLLSVILFPLLIPVLLAGVQGLTVVFSGTGGEGLSSWLGVALAFDALFAGAGLILFPFLYSAEE